ncbi:MAG: hypothetical protein ABIT83_15080 [Massilia sp.]
MTEAFGGGDSSRRPIALSPYARAADTLTPTGGGTIAAAGDASLDAVNPRRGQGGAALFTLRGGSQFAARDVRGMPEREVPGRVDAPTL